MLEIATLFLTLGAIFYKIHVSINTLILISSILSLVGGLVFRNKKGLIFSLILGLVFILGALMIGQIDQVTLPQSFWGQRNFDAKVLSVDQRLERTLMVVRDQDFDQRLQLTLRGQNNFLPGDKIKVKGMVEEPQSFLTQNGRMFDYQKYLLAKGIEGIINDPELILLQKGGLGLTRFATIIRYKVANLLTRYIIFPVDGVVAGMVVGYQGGLPQTTQDLFRQTGVLHVLVLSGYNITLLAGFLAFLLKGLSKRVQIILTILAIVLLVLISGSGVSSLRAGIMGSIALTAGLTIRKYNPLRALVLSYLIFFIISPQIIFVDPGFHLSFLATFFMVRLLSRVKEIFSFVPEVKQIKLKEIMILSFCVPIFMMPYLIYFAGYFPLVSPLTNIILALLTPVLMIGGISLLVLSFLPPVSMALGILISWLGIILIKILTKLSTWPIWHLPSIDAVWIILFYIVLISILLRKEIFEHLKIYFKALS